MIPVRTVDGGRAPSLAALVADNVAALEDGLARISAPVPLGGGVAIDVLCRDMHGQPVLVLVDEGTGEPLIVRSVEALVAYAGALPLLARAHPDAGIAAEGVAAPRVLLVARRFSDRALAMLSLLKVGALDCIECAVFADASGHRLVVTSTSSEAPRAPVQPARKPKARPAAEEVEVMPAPAPAVAAEAPDAAEDKVPLKLPIKPAAVAGKKKVLRVEPAESHGLVIFDETKMRLLRLSPDVIEEEDGNLIAFRVGSQLLATVARDGAGVLVAVGGSGNPMMVTDADSLDVVMEAVFGRFFELSTTRRRAPADGNGRPGRAGEAREAAAS